MKHALDRRTLIGVAERVDLPEWGVTRMRAKIDTGARTSALHVDEIEEIGAQRVRFTIVEHRDDIDERVTVEAPVVRRGRVRSSTGRVQERIYVATRISIGGVQKDVEISLASRTRMIFRMLLGRSALEGDFLVDPSRRYVCSPADDKRRRRRKAKRKKTRLRKGVQKKRKRKTTKSSGKKLNRVSTKKTKKTKALAKTKKTKKKKKRKKKTTRATAATRTKNVRPKVKRGASAAPKKKKKKKKKKAKRKRKKKGLTS